MTTSPRVTAEEAIPYLVQSGLLSPRDIMRGDVRVEDASRRNLNLKVISSRGPSFFVKQADSTDCSTVESIRREARYYQFFENGAAVPRRRLFPRLVHYDADRVVLVLELIPSAISLGQYLNLQAGAPQRETAAAVGRAIAAFQRVRPPQRPSAEQRPDVPWALRFTFPPPDLLRTSSLGQIEVIRIVQKNGDAWRMMAGVRDAYGGDCLVHGDLRWDNLLMRSPHGRTSSRLWVVDWELADVGDPAWDVGSVLAAFLARCVCYMQPGDDINPDSLRSGFVAQLPTAQAEIAAFWNSYQQSATHAESDIAAFLKRATLFCGARLLQVAFEWSPGQTLTPIAACFLQLGLNILRRPDDAPRLIFRIA